MSEQAVTIRAATAPDVIPPANLVAVGGPPHRPGPSLVAEIDGTTVAAISLTTGAVAVDLDRADTRTVRQLKYCRYQLLRQGGNVTSARTLRRHMERGRA
jgi:hypothetical protein